MNSGSKIEVVPVESKKDWDDFFQFKHRLYRNDPAFVRPLRSMERLAIDENVHPFFKHAKQQAYIAKEDGVVVGRVAAIHDQLHNDHYSDKTGFFGFFECEDRQDVANALLDQARDWLVGRGCEVMRGPVNPSMKSDFGVLMQAHHVMPYIMMGHTPLYYDTLIQGYGLGVAKQFFTYLFEPDMDLYGVSEKWDKLAEMEKRILERYPQLRFRVMDKQNFAQTMRDINELGNQVRAENYGFVPLTFDELEFMIKQMRRIIRYDMIHAAYWDDKLVGFIVNLPDLSWALSKTIGGPDWIRMPQLLYWIKRTPRTRVIALGVDKSFRNKGVAMMLIKRLTDVYDAYQRWELSWVVEDNVKSIRAIDRAVPVTKEKVYRLYEGPIGIQAASRQ